MAALAIAGCSRSTASNNSAVTVPGSTLTVWASEPAGAAGGGTVDRDVLEGEELAYKDEGATAIDGFHVAFRIAHGDEASADARQAISDRTAIAYLGEIEPGTSGVSLQITNQVGLLQVSPTDTAAYLTQTVPGVKDSPRTFFPAHSNFGATFGRVAPSTTAEARALVSRMKAVGVSSLAVDDDGTPYGIAVAAEVRSAAAAAGLTVSSGASAGSGAGALLYAGLPGGAATRALDAAASADSHVKLFAASALYDDTFVAGLSSAARAALTVSAPGFLPSGLDPAGRSFASSFRSTYGHAPAPQAVFGFEAMAAVIASLREAGAHAATRQTVVHDFRDLTRSANDSALGAYAINGGDTNLDRFVFAGVGSSGTLVPRAAG